MPLPNFFIAGAPKAGTTSLYHYLDQHPEIYMSPLKEVSYFSEEVREKNFAPALRKQAANAAQSMREYLDAGAPVKRFGGIVDDWDDYCSLFARAGDAKAIGEGSVCYLWSRSAPRRIAEVIPDAKIIVILRNPVDRAFSQYLHNYADGAVRWSFTQHLDAAFARNESDRQCSIVHPFLELGLYAEQLRRYFDHFPREQIGIWLYEDTKKPGFLSEVFDFLGVQTSFRPDTRKHYLQQEVTSVPRLRSVLRALPIWKRLKPFIPDPLLSTLHHAAYRPGTSENTLPADRKRLEEYYAASVAELEVLMARNLPELAVGTATDPQMA